jgi:uncharacterized protein YyaL (SSP411 family)
MIWDYPSSKKLWAFAGREMIYGKATAYVCENFVCGLPVTNAEDLLKAINT